MDAAHWLQGAGALLAVLGLVAVAGVLARRAGLARPAGAGVLRCVAALPVGARERVVVVEVAGRWLVLGVAPGAVRPLADLAPGETPAAAPAPDFARWLAGALKGRPGP